MTTPVEGRAVLNSVLEWRTCLFTAGCINNIKQLNIK